MVPVGRALGAKPSARSRPRENVPRTGKPDRREAGERRVIVSSLALPNALVGADPVVAKPVGAKPFGAKPVGAKPAAQTISVCARQ